MKTKELLLIALMLCCSMGIQAQTNYYKVSKVFEMPGYTYKCDVTKSGVVLLYNMQNTYSNKSIIYLPTGKAIGMDYDPEMVVPNQDTWLKCHSIVNSAFSALQRKRCDGKFLGIELCVDHITGKVLDVIFDFVNFEPFASIPVSVFRQIETDMKKDVSFIPSNEGKKLNYISLYWSQKISNPNHPDD